LPCPISKKIELTHGIYDIIVPPEYNPNEIATPNILICLEMSSKSILSNIFSQVLTSIQSTIDSVQYDLRIGIVTFDTSATFYSVPDNESEQVTLVRTVDADDTFVALGTDDLLFSINDEVQRRKLDRLIETLFTINEQQFQLFSEQKYSSKPVFGSMIKLISDMFDGIGGRALVFASSACRSGPGAFTDENSPTMEEPLKSRNVYFKDMAEKLNAKRTSVDLFLFDNLEFQISTIS
jgi:hypothetical protein